jgi:tryptophanyl-tRNA synthetase
MSKETILTGIRSNGELTLGNYLGAITPMVQLQQQKSAEYNVNFFVPDLHSFTTEVDHKTLFSQTLENLRTFAAAGFDFTNESTFVYRQSFIPAHSELFTILNNFAYFGELSRMTQFKEKSLDSDVVSAGLFTYPVLMASDILIYGAKYVPVGDDQRQHLELTRDLAIRFNNKFGDIFTVPVEWKEQLAFYQRDNGLRIRSLRNPEKKMSKSVSDPAGTILLTDSPSEAAKKIMSATTDSFGEIKFDLAERPGISNLLQILAVVSNRTQAEVNAEWEGKTAYGDLKKATADAVEQLLTTFQTNLAAVDNAQIMAKLEQSEALMRETTAPLLLEVQKAVGLRPNQ